MAAARRHASSDPRRPHSDLNQPNREGLALIELTLAPTDDGKEEEGAEAEAEEPSQCERSISTAER
jgi:hypothetical protein